jgi:outer membrane protein assembly factor BamB
MRTFMRAPCLGVLPAISLLFLVASTALLRADDWPQWRGPKRDGQSPSKGLRRELPKDGLPVAWSVDQVGVGYSSVAVKDSRLFTLGDLGGIEQIICLNVEDGSRMWAKQPEPVAKELEARVAKELKELDRDGDGTIGELEALTRFGWDWNKYNGDGKPNDKGANRLRQHQRAEALFLKLDKDSDLSLSFDEAGGILRDAFDRADVSDKAADSKALAETRTSKYLKLDTNGDGKVSKEEAKGSDLARRFDLLDAKDAVTQMGDELLTRDEILAGLMKTEAGRDGVVTKRELVALFEQTRGGDDELSRDELKGILGGYRDGAGDGPRGTPAVDGDRVYALGAMGDLSCLDAETGNTIWHVHLVRDFKGRRPGSGYCESPLVVADLIVVSPGSEQGTMLALDKMTGKKVWQSSEVKETADYVSAIPANIAGRKQIVQFARESVFGLDLASGKLLWRYTAPASPNANCCTPIVDGDLVFASSSYGTGGGLAQIENKGDVQEATEVYFQKKMTCHYGGMVKVGNCVYSNADGPLVCMDFGTGKIRWQARTVGKGSIVAAGDMLYLVSEGHEIAFVEADPEKFRPRGRFKSPQAKAAVLAHPAIADGKLFVRAQETLTAYDMRDSSNPRVASPTRKINAE